jgi:hypothetical protein
MGAIRYIFQCEGLENDNQFTSIVLAQDIEECLTLLKKCSLLSQPRLYTIFMKSNKVYKNTREGQVVNCKASTFHITYSRKIMWKYLPSVQWCLQGILSNRSWKQVNRRIYA